MEFVSLPVLPYKQLQDDTESADYATKPFLQPVSHLFSHQLSQKRLVFYY